ncbi:S-adenosyl-L-methionine-dependent methyltransferase [Lasiosphaeris hirsuta]|uniref:S-adenosyl-L-methionine-dependent methyltransferase n=1 Tax=Lasiosphaeris hirsuta TaxID=260670 RepID=A0AA40B183_9PEZI|nr:S-adenosyl-L-methionine-dependent methyltransferase [Lasiosphaeris hirsuta]
MASEQNKSLRNKEFFDNEAASYDARHEKTLNQLVEEIRSRLDFIGVDWVDGSDDDSGEDEDVTKEESAPKREVRLLDYACGTGLANTHHQALAPYTTQCIGIDLSGNMVATYNTRAANQGLTPSEMHAYQGNLLSTPPSPSLAAPAFTNFTLAAVGLGFHHFDDPALAARRLVERLAPGGVLVVIDFLPHAKIESTHAASHTVTRHGFEEEEVRGMFEDAGAGEGFRLEEVGIVFNRGVKEDHGHGHEHGEAGHSHGSHSGGEVRRRIFIARGAKGV